MTVTVVFKLIIVIHENINITVRNIITTIQKRAKEMCILRLLFHQLYIVHQLVMKKITLLVYTTIA